MGTRLILALLTIVTLTPVQAQVLYGSIVGTVEDPTGAVVPGARITLTSTETGVTREVEPDTQGRYAILSVVPGTYSLKIAASGFRTLTRTGVEVSINTVTRVDVRLEVGAIAEQVTVSAQALALQTDKSETRAEIGNEAIVNLPLPNFRNYQSLINLVPGATPAEFQNTYMSAPARAMRTQVNGANPNNNTTRVDGAVNVFIWLPHHTVYVPAAESIDTVSISTSSFDAEQGMAGGAAVTLATKSGTNELHGSAFWYHDNQHLRARNYNYRPYSQPALPKTIYNQPGGTVGGPVIRNKLFYFLSYERTMQRNGVSGNFSVPPLDMRTGDFSKYLTLTTIYDPLTGNRDGSGRRPFAGNIVPADRISPIFANIQKLAPAPNQASDDLVYGLTANYGATGTQQLDRDQYDFKANYNPTSRLTVWGKYSRMDGTVTGAAAFKDLVGPGIGSADPGYGTTTVEVPTVGFNYTLSPTFLMDGVYGYTKMDQPAFGFDYGKNYGTDVWKIPGTNGGAQYANDPHYSGMPALYTGFTGWGQLSTPLPWERNDRSQTYSTNFSKMHRAHEVRFGFDMVHHAMNHWQPETANPRGEVNFSGGATMIKDGTSRSPNTYAGALLGIVGSYQKSVQFFLMRTREWQFGWYVRDRWQASRRLTLSLGLRYEYYPLMTRGDRGVERWDPNTNLVTIGGVGGVPMNNGITTSKKLFAPRVGFAYRLNDKTVVRSGYGITFDPLPFSRPMRGLYPSTITASWVAATPYDYYGLLANGVPPVPTPDISAGSIVLPPTIDMGPRSAWGGLLHRGYIQSWNFTLERQLPYQIVGSLGYVGNHTVHWMADRDINSTGPGPLGNAGRPLNARFGRLITTNMWDGFADGNYNGLQMSVNRAYGGGLFIKAAYTWSKAINMADEDGWANLRYFNWEPAIRRNRTAAGYDRRQMLTLALVWAVPVGQGKKVNIGSRALNAIAGGWQLSSVFSAYTGTPFSVSGSGASLNAPGNSQTADLIAPVRKIGNFGPGQSYYDPMSFRDPNFNRPSGVYRFGTMGPNSIYGPGYWRDDVNLTKNFSITERVKAEFRAQAFNLTNTIRWSNPSSGSASMQLNPDGTLRNANNFMSITGTPNDYERQVRFGLRVSF